MGTAPRYRRRKEDRPDQIADAAFEVFAEKGYAAARVDDVAARAGVSKGLTYLYYKTKEELFKAVVRNVVVRRLDSLVESLQSSDLPAEAFIRGPLQQFMKSVPGSPIAVVVRLLIAEAPRHPDLVRYYYDNVVARGLAAIEEFVNRGVDRGELKPAAREFPPQLLVAPVIAAVMWRLVFAEKPLDTDALIETHIDMLLTYLGAEGGSA